MARRCAVRRTRASLWWNFPISNARICSAAVKQVDIVMAAYPKDVKLIYKQFPLSMHPHAELAAEASLAAREQGKFWEMYDVLFKNFRQLSRDNILAMAKEIGLDVDKFKADLDSGKYKAVVEKDLADGEAAGVYGTPAFYINGKQYNGEVTLAALKPILEAELKGEQRPRRVADEVGSEARRYRLPREACSRSIASNRALKFPLPKLRLPLRWIIS